MSTYADFAEKFLIAIYQETISTGQPHQRVSAIVSKYGLEPKANWIAQIADEWEHVYFSSVSKVLGGYDSWSFRMSGSGTRYIEEKYGSKDGVGVILQPVVPDSVLLTEDGRPLLTEDGQFIELESNEFVDALPSMRIDSADWTGIAQRLESDPALVQQISKHISEIDQLIEKSGLTNAERQKAKAITESLKLLVASPEPEWKAIALLLTSPTLIAVLNVSAIVQIVLKLFGIG